MGFLEWSSSLEVECPGLWLRLRTCGFSSVFGGVFAEFRGVDRESELAMSSASFYPSLFFAFRKVGGAVGAFTTHIDDILRFGPL